MRDHLCQKVAHSLCLVNDRIWQTKNEMHLSPGGFFDQTRKIRYNEPNSFCFRSFVLSTNLSYIFTQRFFLKLGNYINLKLSIAVIHVNMSAINWSKCLHAYLLRKCANPRRSFGNGFIWTKKSAQWNEFPVYCKGTTFRRLIISRFRGKINLWSESCANFREDGSQCVWSLPELTFFSLSNLSLFAKFIESYVLAKIKSFTEVNEYFLDNCNHKEKQDIKCM